MGFMLCQNTGFFVCVGKRTNAWSSKSQLCMCECVLVWVCASCGCTLW